MPKPPSRNNPNLAKTPRLLNRSASKPIEIKDLLGKTVLGAKPLQEAGRAQASWREFLRSHFGEELDREVRDVAVRNGELTVYASSPAWSARLRYALAPLINDIRARDPAVKRTSVRIQPAAAKAGGRT